MGGFGGMIQSVDVPSFESFLKRMTQPELHTRLKIYPQKPYSRFFLSSCDCDII